MDHKTIMFNSRFEASYFLKILRNLSAADESVAEIILSEDGLAEISVAIQMDPNRYIEGVIDLFWEVLYGTEILWHILRAENRKLVPRVRLELNILPSISVTFQSKYILKFTLL